jgi:hypothetical protein
VTAATSIEIRARLVEALELDLVGPRRQHGALQHERLRSFEYPSRFYLTGFLVPIAAKQEQKRDVDEDDGENEVVRGGLVEESNEDRKAAKKSFFPSSMGISFLVAADARELEVRVSWGDYAPVEEGAEEKKERFWQRTPREVSVRVALGDASPDPRKLDVPDSGGLQLHVLERAIATDGLGTHLPHGTRSVSVFLVNARPPDHEAIDRASVFQPELEVRSAVPFVPRPNLRGALVQDDFDEQVADLHYADSPEFAAGHGVSAEWDVQGRTCRVLRTAWIPSAEVEKTETAKLEGIELSMDLLGALSDGPQASATLTPLVAAYRDWIDKRAGKIATLPPPRRETAEQLLEAARVAAMRMERGIDVLATDADALDAFRLANRAVARALRQRLREQAEHPAWRAFQLAFVLVNLEGIAKPESPHREIVDLLFFPTGGGKTEAYLGLAAFTMVLRRLRNPGDDGRAGAGVSVIMRYTLRLLTLDQLSRAAGLVCALELEREQAKGRYGTWPFEIGLWVGKAATPNVLGHKGEKTSDSARRKLRAYQKDSDSNPAPIPLENCPWCGTRFSKRSFQLLPDEDRPRDLRITCASAQCEFVRERPLPIVAVDEPLYRRLPAFLIATVDKFASLPWVAESGVLLGGADRADAHGFYGPADPTRGQRLSAPLAPPDLVIQDELHLISGPLGTMAGLYETAIEALCTRSVGDRVVRPKIVASTATARRASSQIQALFGRGTTHVFPPPGPDRRDSFFAQVVDASKVPARLYVGIAAQGRNPKVVMRRACLALMAAAQKAFVEEGGRDNRENAADPYMTLLGYFNSLRELGGARRIFEEEVQSTLKRYADRKRVGEERGLFANRTEFAEVWELTSRVPTNQVAAARRALEARFAAKQGVDCALATNMISVGLDILRLGLMVVYGQPKTNSEYIQATSRVGRDDSRPGLVVTLLNIHKPRDRSHYERFRHYHETFYRGVEVASVTPFSARALDRGLAGALVALARHAERTLAPPLGAEQISEVRASLEARLKRAFLARVRQQPIEEEAERAEREQSVQERIGELLEAWGKVVEGYHELGGAVKYQRWEDPKPAKPLLREMLDEKFESAAHRLFRAGRSLRDVEPEVNLFLHDLTGDEIEADA